jgi:hypothetical protein
VRGGRPAKGAAEEEEEAEAVASARSGVRRRPGVSAVEGEGYFVGRLVGAAWWVVDEISRLALRFLASLLDEDVGFRLSSSKSTWDMMWHSEVRDGRMNAVE